MVAATALADPTALIPETVAPMCRADRLEMDWFFIIKLAEPSRFDLIYLLHEEVKWASLRRVPLPFQVPALRA